MLRTHIGVFKTDFKFGRGLSRDTPIEKTKRRLPKEENDERTLGKLNTDYTEADNTVCVIFLKRRFAGVYNRLFRFA